MCLVQKFSHGILQDSYSKHNKCWSISGFSLMEMLVVIAIIGILSLPVLAPANRIIAEIGLRQMAVLLARDIRYVQQQTIQEPSVNWRLEFAADQQSWLVSRDNVTQYTRELPAGITLNGTENISNRQFTFGETGQPEGVGTVFLNNDHARYSITVTAFTGRIRWARES